MTDIDARLSRLRQRRLGADRISALTTDDLSDLARKLGESEQYEVRAGSQKWTKYTLGAMQAVDARYTEISLEEATRVGKHLESNLGIEAQFRLQGSVPTNTHIRGVSDVDLLVLDNRFMTYDIDGQAARNRQYASTVPYTPVQALQSLRSNSAQILRNRFPAANVECGSKAIKISGGSLRRPVDVVPSHWHNTAEYQSNFLEASRGVNILDNSVPCTVLNLPFKHIGAINSGDVIGCGGLKRAIRLCKTLRADAKEEGNAIELSSFDIASTMWHVPPADFVLGFFNELKILEVASKQLSLLSGNHFVAQSLHVPDGTRKIFDTQRKLQMLDRLAAATEELVVSVANEQTMLPMGFLNREMAWAALSSSTRFPSMA